MKENKQMKQRDTTIDMAAGFLIIVMMMGHVMQGAGLFETTFYEPLHWFFFFMPWFFFKAGMFHRNQSVNKCLTGGKKLLQPFAIFTILGYLGYQLVQIKIHGQAPFGTLHNDIAELLSETSMPGNKPLWFLVPLFVVKIIANLFNNRPKNLILLIIALVIAYTMQRFNFSQCLLIPTTLTGWFFYEMGHLYKERASDKYLVGLCSMVYFALLLTILPIVDMRTNTSLRGEYLLWFPASLSGILLFNYALSQLHREIKILKYVGVHAMDFYVWHGLILTVSTPVLHYILRIDDFAQVSVNVLLIAICIPAIIKSKQMVSAIRLSKK